MSWFTKTFWRRSGPPPNFDIQFFRGDGRVIGFDVLQPTVTEYTGYRKVSVSYKTIGISSDSSRPTTDTSDALGNDARSVTNVSMQYIINGERFTLSHG